MMNKITYLFLIIWGLLSVDVLGYSVIDLETEIAEFIAKSSIEKKDISIKLKQLKLSSKIPGLISRAGNTDLGNPTSERLSIVKEIAEKLAPLEDLLFKVGVDARGRPDYEILALTYYLNPTEQLKGRLLEGIDSNRGKSLSWKYYDVAFHLRLFDYEFRNRLSEDLENYKGRGISGLGGMVSTWGMIEALPIYRKLLSVPFDCPKQNGKFIEESKLEAGYKIAAKALTYLGELGAELLPLVEQRMLELKQCDGNSPFALNQLKAAKDILAGERPAMREVARNGSGSISLLNLNEDSQEVEEEVMPLKMEKAIEKTVESLTVVEKPEETPKPIEVVEVEQPAEKSSNWLLWVVLLIALIGVIAFVSRKKK